MQNNYIELQLEKVYKEYMEVKNFLLNFARKENLEEIKKDIAQNALKEQTDDDRFEYYFKKLGWTSAVQADLTQLKARLFHTYEAYKELVEPPKEIKEEIEKELQDIVFKLTYNIKANQAELVDQKLLEYYKNQAKEIFNYANKLP